MDSVASGLAVATNEAQLSCQPQELHSSLSNNTPTRVPRRKGSVFSLAGSFFKSQVRNDDVDQPGKQDSPPIKGSWNPFASLRGLKESKKKSRNFVTTRCKSSSPQKDDTSRLDEFGKRKTMKRKSLQDLLGAMGTKLSRGRRHVVEEVNNPSSDDEDDEPTAPTFFLPVPMQLGAESPKVHSLVISSDRMVTISDLSKPERNEEQTNNDVPALFECTDVSQTDRDIDFPKSPEDLRSSSLHDSIQISAIPSPEKVCSGEFAEFLQDVSSQMQKNVTFSDGEPPPSYRLSTTSKNANKHLSTLYVDTSFDMSSTKGKESFDSTRCEPLSSTTDISSKEIAKHIISTAAKISENYHLSQSQNRRLLDSSESDADNVSHYSWDATQPEVWDVIDKGREAMTQTKPTPYFHSGFVPGSSSTETASVCSAQGASSVAGNTPRTDSEPFNINLKAQNATEDISADSIRVIHPRCGSRGPFTSQHASMSDALSDLCQNYAEYSTYCLFDRVNMALFPQPARGYLDTERPQQWDGGLEVIWLQMQSCSPRKTLAGPQHVSATESREAASIALADSNSDGQCAPLVCAPETSTSRRGSVASKCSSSQSEEIDSKFETAVDSATARLYLGSSYSSADSINSSKLVDFTHPGLTNFVRFEIDDVASRNTKPLKTWADLGKEFLDRHAPGSNSSPELRAKIAVHEALKSRRASAASCEGEQNAASGSDCLNSSDIEDAEHQKWSRDRGSSDDIPFDYAEDIGEYESEREELEKISKTLSTQADFSHLSKPNPAMDASIISKMTMEAIRSAFRGETLASQKKFSVDLGPGYMSPMCPVRMHRTSDRKVEQDQTKCPVSNASVEESCCENTYGDVPYDGDVGIKMPSVDTITQNRDEVGAIVAETSRKTLAPAEYRQSNDHYMAKPVIESLVSRGGIEGKVSIPGYEEWTMPKKPGNFGFATEKTSTGRLCLEVTSTRQEVAGYRSQSLTFAEALSASLSPTPLLSSSPSRTKSSNYSPIIPSPLSGQKRVLTPGKRVLTPLANMYQPRSVEVQVPAPPPSEAETEVSLDFGQELQRCGFAEEDGKEIGDRWNKAFMLYGHRIHYTGLKDTI